MTNSVRELPSVTGFRSLNNLSKVFSYTIKAIGPTQTFQHHIDVDPKKEVYGSTYANLWDRDNSVFLAKEAHRPYTTDFNSKCKLYDAVNKRPIIRSESINLSPENSIIFDKIVVPRGQWYLNWEIPAVAPNGDIEIEVPFRRRYDGQIIYTGKKGRGVLGQFGPNVAVDPIVSCWKRDSLTSQVVKDKFGLPIFKVALITRGQDGVEFSSLEEAASKRLLAIPGGMLELGDTLSRTLKKEFGEEALGSLVMSDLEQEIMKQNLDNFFQNGYTVYTGYCDDPRDTDNAWIVTEAKSFHDHTGKTVSNFKLKAGDDATHVCWYEWDRENPPLLYAKHSEIVNVAMQLQTFMWQQYYQYLQ